MGSVDVFHRSVRCNLNVKHTFVAESVLGFQSDARSVRVSVRVSECEVRLE